MNRRNALIAIACGATLIAGLAPPPSAHSQTSRMGLDFLTHAAFFSEETHQPVPLDPHVFVQETGAPAGNGPQNIQHIAGLRPAHISDPGSLPVFTAPGRPLGFSLAQWLGASGTVTITNRPGGNSVITARFRHLRPNGIYSLFENHFDQNPVGFTPLDGTGKRNTFKANPNGTATISVRPSGVLTHDNAVLLVYHSDRQAHGASRGEIGINAHHQLIARIP